MKLWVDDVRSPPDDSWRWTTSAYEARGFLCEVGRVTECSLDHDLGEDAETGYDLVRWMVINRRVPARVTVHSWNPVGARRMAHLLRTCAYDVELAPAMSSTSGSGSRDESPSWSGQTGPEPPTRTP